MKKTIGALGWPVFIMAILSLGGLIYNFIFYERLRPLILGFGDISPILDNMQIPAAGSFIFIFIFHITALAYVFIQMMYFKRESLLLAAVFFLAIMSALMMLGDFALLGDMGKEHAAGLDTSGEWPVLYLSQALHLLFVILLIVLISATSKKLKRDQDDIVLRDEAIFINAQYIGLLCGLSGMGSFAVLSVLTPLWALRKGIFPVSLISIFPYMIIVIYWLAIKAKERSGSWYDEKQFRDMTRGSLFTLVASIIAMTIVFMAQYFSQVFEYITIIWWPFYVFLVLLLFSASILYYSKRASG